MCSSDLADAFDRLPDALERRKNRDLAGDEVGKRQRLGRTVERPHDVVMEKINNEGVVGLVLGFVGSVQQSPNFVSGHSCPPGRSRTEG